MGTGAATFEVTRAVSQETSTFVLNFENVTHGSTITLFSRGNIVNASNFPANKRLVLRFDTALKQSDYPGGFSPAAHPGFRVTWQ